MFRHGNCVHVYTRLFDRFDGSFVLSENAAGYACSEVGIGWLIDVSTRTIRETNIDELRAMAANSPD